MRKRSEWVEDAAVFGIAILDIIITLPAAVYVHENMPQWETLAVFVSLGLGVLPALWYWRVRRHGWVAAILASLFLTFSFGIAFAHGWEAQALTLFTLVVGAVMVIVVVGLFVSFARITRRFESAMRTVGEELNGDPLFRRETLFRDDGQRIIVYPRRWRLVFMCVGQAAIVAGIGCVFVFLSPNVSFLWIVSGLFVCVLIPIFLATLSRLVIRRPALVVGPDGIHDYASFIWSGVGLLRWDEILQVYPTTRESSRVKQHFLDIMVTDLPGIRRRLPLLKRIALRNTYSGMSQLLIMQTLLETPVDELAEQIAQYVETHAPPGWRDGAEKDNTTISDNDGVET